MSNIFVDRSGHVYKTVKIGNQVWMAENLRYAGVHHYSVNKDSRNDEKYGYLYDWDAAVKACPTGWRLPTQEDFEELLSTTGGRFNSEKLLELGFQQAGYIWDQHWAMDFGRSGYYWGAEPIGSDEALLLTVHEKGQLPHIGSYFRNAPMSVRYIKVG